MKHLGVIGLLVLMLMAGHFFNSEVLAIAPYPPQIVFCNAEVTGLDDLAGKKIRASGRMTATLGAAALVLHQAFTPTIAEAR